MSLMESKDANVSWKIDTSVFLKQTCDLRPWEEKNCICGRPIWICCGFPNGSAFVSCLIRFSVYKNCPHKTYFSLDHYVAISFWEHKSPLMQKSLFSSFLAQVSLSLSFWERKGVNRWMRTRKMRQWRNRSGQFYISHGGLWKWKYGKP